MAKPRSGRPVEFDSEVIVHARQIIKKLKEDDSLRGAISILLAEVLNASCKDIGNILNLHPVAVSQMHGRFRRFVHGDVAPCRNRADKVRSVLKTFEEQAAAGSPVFAKQVRSELEKLYGRKIPSQTAYYILKQNGWRKIAITGTENGESENSLVHRPLYRWLPASQEA